MMEISADLLDGLRESVHSRETEGRIWKIMGELGVSARIVDKDREEERLRVCNICS